MVNDAVWPHDFPGGVADASGEHALYRDRQGRLVALRLDDGRMLWRSEASLRPLLIGAGLALGLAAQPPRVVALALEGASAGQPAWISLPLPWPEWAAAADTASVNLELEAAWLGKDLGLRWHLRRLYAGGARPGPGQTGREESTGACRIDAVRGAMHPLQQWPERADNKAPLDAVEDPQVLAQHRIGERHYQVVAHDAGSVRRTVLVAHDAAAGHLLWEHLIDEGARRSPAPLRP